MTMQKKRIMVPSGFYSGAVALVAVAIIISVVFAISSKAGVEEQGANINEIVYLKWHSQNAYQLLWDSSADAVADSLYEVGMGSTPACHFPEAYNEGNMRAKVEEYFEDNLENTGLGCTVGNVELSGEFGVAGKLTATIGFTLVCEKELDGMRYTYTKEREFVKNAFIESGGTACLVDVEDVTGPSLEVCQVDKIPSPGGCTP